MTKESFIEECRKKGLDILSDPRPRKNIVKVFNTAKNMKTLGSDNGTVFFGKIMGIAERHGMRHNGTEGDHSDFKEVDNY